MPKPNEVIPGRTQPHSGTAFRDRIQEPQPAPGAAPGTPGQESPEQDEYAIFVSQGILAADKMAESLKGKASVDALGDALFNILREVTDEGKKNGVDFSPGVISRGIEEILVNLLEASEVDITEDQIKGVIGIAVGQYIVDALKTGKMTKEQLNQYAQQMQQAMPAGGGQPGPGPRRPGGRLGIGQQGAGRPRPGMGGPGGQKPPVSAAGPGRLKVPGSSGVIS